MRNLLHLRSFCFIYTAQVGVVTLSCIGLTLTVITIVVNIASEDPETIPTRRFFFGFFIILCIVAYAAGLLSVLNDQDFEFSKKVALIGVICQCLLIFYWLLLTIISLSSSSCTSRFICMYNRCADRWFIQSSGQPFEPRHYTCRGDEKAYHSGFIARPNSNLSRNIEDIFFPPLPVPSYRNESFGVIPEDEYYGHEMKKHRCFTRFANWVLSMICAGLLFVFFAYSALIFISYLNTIDIYFEPPILASKSLTTTVL